MQVHRVFARQDAARIGRLVIEAGDVGAFAEIVAQQVEYRAALVRIADRNVARSLDPEIDIGIDLVGQRTSTMTLPGGVVPRRSWRRAG